VADVYRHYKGGIYNVIGMGRHTETKEELVFYEDTDGKLWARPVENFLENVEINGRKVPRFQHLGSFYK